MRTKDLIRFKRHIEQCVAAGHDTFHSLQATHNLAEIDKELELRSRYSHRWELLAEDWGFDYPKQ